MTSDKLTKTGPNDKGVVRHQVIPKEIEGEFQDMIQELSDKKKEVAKETQLAIKAHNGKEDRLFALKESIEPIEESIENYKARLGEAQLALDEDPEALSPEYIKELKTYIFDNTANIRDTKASIEKLEKQIAEEDSAIKAKLDEIRDFDKSIEELNKKQTEAVKKDFFRAEELAKSYAKELGYREVNFHAQNPTSWEFRFTEPFEKEKTN